jgi:hypothetical protein
MDCDRKLRAQTVSEAVESAPLSVDVLSRLREHSFDSARSLIGSGGNDERSDFVHA